MKLSEYSNEQSLDVLADLIDPAFEILADEEVRQMFQSGQPKLKLIKPVIKNHKKAIIEILATLDGVPVDEYKVNVFTLPMKVLEILNDPDFMTLFSSQDQPTNAPSSGLATENTTASEK